MRPDEALNRANRLGKGEEEEEKKKKKGLPSICNTRRSKLKSKRHFVPGPGGTTHGGCHDNAEGGRRVLGRCSWFCQFWPAEAQQLLEEGGRVDEKAE